LRHSPFDCTSSSNAAPVRPGTWARIR
jgi:hypothetical protein